MCRGLSRFGNSYFYVSIKKWVSESVSSDDTCFIYITESCQSYQGTQTEISIRDIPLLLYEKIKYAAKIGSLIYTMVKTPINIAFATLMVSRFAENLGPDYFSVSKMYKCS